MLQGIDHLVIAVTDPDAAAAATHVAPPLQKEIKREESHDGKSGFQTPASQGAIR